MQTITSIASHNFRAARTQTLPPRILRRNVIRTKINIIESHRLTSNNSYMYISFSWRIENVMVVWVRVMCNIVEFNETIIDAADLICVYVSVWEVSSSAQPKKWISINKEICAADTDDGFTAILRLVPVCVPNMQNAEACSKSDENEAWKREPVMHPMQITIYRVLHCATSIIYSPFVPLSLACG